MVKHFEFAMALHLIISEVHFLELRQYLVLSFSVYDLHRLFRAPESRRVKVGVAAVGVYASLHESFQRCDAFLRQRDIGMSVI